MCAVLNLERLAIEVVLESKCVDGSRTRADGTWRGSLTLREAGSWSSWPLKLKLGGVEDIGVLERWAEYWRLGSSPLEVQSWRCER